MSARAGWSFVAVSLVWGVPYFFSAIALESVEPVDLVFLRVLIGGLVLLPFVLRRSVLATLRGKVPAVLLAGAVQGALPLLLLTWAQTRVPGSLVALLLAAQPIVAVGILGFLSRADRPDLRQLICLLLALGGVGLAVAPGPDGVVRDGWGVVAVLAATFLYAAGPVVVGRRLTTASPVGVVGIGLLVNSVVLGAVLLARGIEIHATARSLGATAILGIFCTGLAFVVYHALVSRTGVGIATLTAYLNPVVAILLGVLLLGEALSAPMVLGFAIILLCCWFGVRAARRGPMDRPALGRPHSDDDRHDDERHELVSDVEEGQSARAVVEGVVGDEPGRGEAGPQHDRGHDRGPEKASSVEVPGDERGAGEHPGGHEAHEEGRDDRSRGVARPAARGDAGLLHPVVAEDLRRVPDGPDDHARERGEDDGPVVDLGEHGGPFSIDAVSVES